MGRRGSERAVLAAIVGVVALVGAELAAALPGPVEPADRAPVWSADGTRLAYVSNDRGLPGEWEVLDLAMGATRRFAVRTPERALSPQLDRVAFPFRPPAASPGPLPIPAPAPQPTQVLVSTLDGGTTQVALGEEPLAWSPDGTTLAFRRGADLLVVQPGGAERVVATADPGDADQAWFSALAWTPDGRRLVAEHRRTSTTGRGGTSIWVIGLDGSGVRHVVEEQPDGVPVGWPAYAAEPVSPDGRWVLLQHGAGEAVYALDGSGRNELATVGVAAWAPDGSEIALVWPGRQTLWLADPTTGATRELPLAGYAVGSPATWSPDSRRVAVATGTLEVFDVGTGARSIIDVGPGGPGIDPPRWSPDGGAIAFAAGDVCPVGIHLAPVDGAPVRWLTNDCRIVGTPGDDRLVGTAGPDLVLAGAGDDTILAGSGADSVDAGAGDDVVRAGGAAGSADADTVVGGAGDDLLTGGRLGDVLLGGAGADTLLGGRGVDSLVGGAGRDRLSGGSEADLIAARDGAPDRVDGGSQRDAACVDRFDLTVAVELLRLGGDGRACRLGG